MTDQEKANFWIKQIDRLLDNNIRFRNGHSTLEGIKETISSNHFITDKQIQAIKNIRWGKNELKENPS